ncbi:calponin homology domain-containing protein, partial [Baffinella frigidus]
MPKGELLTWVNTLVECEFSELQQCANGAAYCCVLDALFPEDFPIRKVLFSAKAEHDSIKNYKIIQQFFTKKGVSSEMDVEKLLKGRPMEHLAFLQWLRGFFDHH